MLIEDDDRIGAEHKVAVDGRGFLARKPEHVIFRCLAGLNLFRNAGDADFERDAGMLENLAAAGRLRGQNEHRPTW